MCLQSIASRSVDPKAAGFGWKVFRRVEGRLHSELRDTGLSRLPGVEYTSRDGLASFGTYLVGFHIFKTRAAARLWKDIPGLVVRKVSWRHRLAKGVQAFKGVGFPVVVAHYMTILPLKGAP